MENIEKVLLLNNCHRWQLYEYINDSSLLSENEKSIFNDIWEKSEKYILHNYSMEAGVTFITDNYHLSEKAAGIITISLLYLLK